MTRDEKFKGTTEMTLTLRCYECPEQLAISGLEINEPAKEKFHERGWRVMYHVWHCPKCAERAAAKALAEKAEWRRRGGFRVNRNGVPPSKEERAEARGH